MGNSTENSKIECAQNFVLLLEDLLFYLFRNIIENTIYQTDFARFMDFFFRLWQVFCFSNCLSDQSTEELLKNSP